MLVMVNNEYKFHNTEKSHTFATSGIFSQQFNDQPSVTLFL